MKATTLSIGENLTQRKGFREESKSTETITQPVQ